MHTQSRTPTLRPADVPNPDIDRMLSEAYVTAADSMPGGRHALGFLAARVKKAQAGTRLPHPSDLLAVARGGGDMAQTATYLHNLADALMDASVELPVTTLPLAAREVGEAIAAGATAVLAACPRAEAIALREIGEGEQHLRALRRSIGASRFARAAVRTTPAGRVEVMR